jgi:hypothetical protein
VIQSFESAEDEPLIIKKLQRMVKNPPLTASIFPKLPAELFSFLVEAPSYEGMRIFRFDHQFRLCGAILNAERSEASSVERVAERHDNPPSPPVPLINWQFPL